MYQDNLPIYLQIIRAIQNDMLSSKLSPGDQLPSVRDYATTMQVNPNTVQRAYRELEIKEFIFTKRGVGNFITEDREKIEILRRERLSEALHTFLDSMKHLGYARQEVLDLLYELEEQEWNTSSKSTD